MFQIDSVEYIGVGTSSEEANENAASQYLNSMAVGTHQASVSTRKTAPNSGSAIKILVKKKTKLTEQ